MEIFSQLPATYVLIIINVLISLMGFSQPAFFHAMKFDVGAVRRGEFHRLISAGFLHVNPTHLMVNMITLFFFGPALESSGFLGVNGFLVVYFISLIAGNLWALLENINDPYYSAVGASGAVSGVLVAVSLFAPFAMIYIMFIIPMPAILFTVLFVAWSAFAMGRDNSNIGHEAHLGGAIAGLLVTMLMRPGIVNHLIDQVMALV